MKSEGLGKILVAIASFFAGMVVIYVFLLPKVEEEAYQRGVEATSIDYYSKGFQNGKAAGYDSGYSDGMKDGEYQVLSRVSEGTDDEEYWFDSGYSIGYDDGYGFGYLEGYDNGYDDGYEDCEEELEYDDHYDREDRDRDYLFW